MVGVLQGYSNLSHQGGRIRTLLAMTPARELTPPSPKKVMRKLRAEEAAKLAAAYRAGATVKALAAVHGIHRETVSIVLERQGVPRRYRKLTTDDVEAAAAAYAAGDTLATIAYRFDVNRSTVGRQLVRAGVTLRKRNK